MDLLISRKSPTAYENHKGKLDTDPMLSSQTQPGPPLATQCSASHFRLSDLPLELRTTIYEACLIVGKYLVLQLLL